MALTTEEKTAVGTAIGAKPAPKKDRPEVRIPGVEPGVEDMRAYLAQKGPRKAFGVLLEYVEKPSRTPSGGRFVSRRVTVKRADGTVWVGQYKNGASTVILRPAPKG